MEVSALYRTNWNRRARTSNEMVQKIQKAGTARIKLSFQVKKKKRK